MDRTTDIVIAGALARLGLDVVLVDKQPARARAAAAFDGRGYALSLASQRLLAVLEVWPLVQEAQPLLDIKVSDGHAGQGAALPFAVHFDHADLEEGPMGYMVEDRFLYRALCAALERQGGITALHGEAVVGQQPGERGIEVALASGGRIRARLLVGCDGRQSGVARRAGIARHGWDYGQTALVCAIAHEAPHHGVAHQFFMPAGPLAILPLPGHRSSIVWSETHPMAEALSALDDAAYLQVLQPRFGDFLGRIRLAGQRFRYPLALSVARRFTGARVALVGDAAHGLHPLAGQGLNAGLGDVAALAQVVAQAIRRGEDFASAAVLARYGRWRQFDINLLVAATDACNSLFSNDSPILRLARGLGMGLVNAVPPMRRALMREAAGLVRRTPDLPDLTRPDPRLFQSRGPHPQP